MKVANLSNTRSKLLRCLLHLNSFTSIRYVGRGLNQYSLLEILFSFHSWKCWNIRARGEKRVVTRYTKKKYASNACKNTEKCDWPLRVIHFLILFTSIQNMYSFCNPPSPKSVQIKMQWNDHFVAIISSFFNFGKSKHQPHTPSPQHNYVLHTYNGEKINDPFVRYMNSTWCFRPWHPTLTASNIPLISCENLLKLSCYHPLTV